MKKISIFSIAIAFIAIFFACSTDENSTQMGYSTTNLKTETGLALIDIPGIEIAIVPEMGKNNVFNEYYIFEYDILNETFFDVTAVQDAAFIEATGSHVKLEINSQVVTFTIDSNYTNPYEIIFYGNGLAHKTADKYFFNGITGDIGDLSEAIEVNNQTYSIGGTITCYSGGSGTSECSAEGTVLGGGGSCSVKCNSGFYACCDDTVNKCKCIKESSSGGKQPKQIVKYTPW